jgi:hypothetical protein
VAVFLAEVADAATAGLEDPQCSVDRKRTAAEHRIERTEGSALLENHDSERTDYRSM